VCGRQQPPSSHVTAAANYHPEFTAQTTVNHCLGVSFSFFFHLLIILKYGKNIISFFYTYNFFYFDDDAALT
jgi:hypothetical protein